MRTWVVVLIGVAVVYLALVIALIVAGKRIAARELALLVPNLLLLFNDLLRDPLGIAAVWLASPIDLLPEFLPFLGPLDDAVVAALVLRYLVRRSGPEVVRRHWRGDPRVLEMMLRAARVA
jgi:hypothetical protein